MNLQGLHEGGSALLLTTVLKRWGDDEFHSDQSSRNIKIPLKTHPELLLNHHRLKTGGGVYYRWDEKRKDKINGERTKDSSSNDLAVSVFSFRTKVKLRLDNFLLGVIP